jgi:hypothetical protein
MANNATVLAMKKMFCILIILIPFVVYAQQRVDKYSPLDYLWMNIGKAGFSPMHIASTSLAFSPSGEPYVAFIDSYHSYKATVMKYDGINWILVGNTGFSAGNAWYLNLAFSQSGQPYVAYMDDGNSQKSTVMKFNGNVWENVGNSGFSPDTARYQSLAFSPTGEPHVAFMDCMGWGYISRASVMKFDGTNWVFVGSRAFSEGYVAWTSLAFSPSGEPYVAYEDGKQEDRITVMKFNGTNWEIVGNAGFSSDYSQCISLAINPFDSQPFVAFNDGGNSNRVTVMKFNGVNWVNVGNIGFSEGFACSTSLAFSQTGQPYVAFTDYGNEYKGFVKKYDGINWVNVGTGSFAEEKAFYISLAFSPLGNPHVSFCDYANNARATVMKFDSVFVGIMEPDKSILIISPNPATGKLWLETPLDQSLNKLSIINLIGVEMIAARITTPKTQIDIGNLPGGVYFVRLTNEKTVMVGQFIKR